MIEKIKRASEHADIIEIRFDHLDPRDLDRALSLAESERTLLFTFRPSEEGGRDLPFDERLRFWEKVLNSHRNDLMIDLECDPKLLMAIDPPGIKRIVSRHHFERVEDLDSTWDSLAAFSDIGKIAITADDIVETIPLWKLLDKADRNNKKIIPIAMGEAGKWTRILGLAHGAFMTYASLDEGDETAPGQVTARDLVETYRVKELNKSTEVYGVMGDPVASSLSPYIHNPAFASAGLNAVFVPLMVRDLDAFIERMVLPKTREIELNFRGFAVTMPHKQTIIKYLDEINPTARTIGAVNTVKIDVDGKLTGYNTDAVGFIEPLKQRYGSLNDARVAVLGSGGAARACVYALKQENCEVTVFARDGNKASILASEFQVRSSPLSQLTPADLDIVVNATPVGMIGGNNNDSILNASQLKGVKFVYDLVTAPAETMLIREAKAAGVEAIGGLEMLIAQAAKQFEIWTGHPADLDLMRASAMKHVK